MSRKDFIIVADSCIDAINFGYIKKKDASDYIKNTCKHLSKTNAFFSYDRFVTYVENGIMTKGVRL